MGIDYDGVGGIGLEVDSTLLNAFVSAGKFTQDEWDYDSGHYLNEACKSLGLSYSHAGNAYSGCDRYYILVDGNNLAEIIANAQKFIEAIATLGIGLKYEDLLVFGDYYIS